MAERRKMNQFYAMPVKNSGSILIANRLELKNAQKNDNKTAIFLNKTLENAAPLAACLDSGGILSFLNWTVHMLGYIDVKRV